MQLFDHQDELLTSVIEGVFGSQMWNIVANFNILLKHSVVSVLSVLSRKLSRSELRDFFGNVEKISRGNVLFNEIDPPFDHLSGRVSLYDTLIFILGLRWWIGDVCSWLLRNMLRHDYFFILYFHNPFWAANVLEFWFCTANWLSSLSAIASMSGAVVCGFPIEDSDLVNSAFYDVRIHCFVVINVQWFPPNSRLSDGLMVIDIITTFLIQFRIFFRRDWHFVF